MKFSLLNLLLALTAIAVVVGLYSAQRENMESARRHASVVAELKADKNLLAKENKSLRQELGCLTITQPEKIHAIKLRTDQPKTWSYRVYLPKGKNYYFGSQINSLPLSNKPPLVNNPLSPNVVGSITNRGRGIGVHSGEYIATLTVRKIEDEWGYQMSVRKAGDADGGSSTGLGIETGNGIWPTTDNAIGTMGVFNQTEISVENSPLVLLNFRAMHGNVTNSLDSNQGAMLWVGTSN